MSTTTETEATTRTDYGVCACSNDQHAVSAHVTHPRHDWVAAKRFAERIPGAHVVSRSVTWTPWRKS